MTDCQYCQEKELHSLFEHWYALEHGKRCVK